MPVDHAPECEVKPGSVKLLLLGVGGDRIEHIGQKTVGYATRNGANVEIAFEAAKVRRPLLSVDSLVEKRTCGSVHGLQWFYHPELCAASGSGSGEAEHEATERTLLAVTRSKH